MTHYFLNFDDAVSLTDQLLNMLNSGKYNNVLDHLGKVFNLERRQNFRLHYDRINKNCPECSGCHNGGCILGCLKHGPGEPTVFCFWDDALESILGTKLVLHEVGHLIKEQGFHSRLSGQEDYDQSEKFAQYVEDHFDVNLQFAPTDFRSYPKIHNLTLAQVGDSVTNGFLFGVGLSIFAVTTYFIFKRNPLSLSKRK